MDVAIVGGGFTGLWTARELLRRDPSLHVAVVEAHVCGFGASGRNGGWASALYPQAAATVIADHGRDAYDHLRHVLQHAVGELGRAAAEDDIDADFVHGGTLYAARTHAQVERLRAEVDHARQIGVSEADLAWLDREEFAERLTITGARGGTFSPHCARLNPARLVRGLATAVERLGATIYEGSPVTRIEPADRHGDSVVATAHGSLHAHYVVRATEGYTPTVARQRRRVVPLYSLMIATAPQSTDFWESVGLAHYETFADARHVVIYGQRTSDDRIAFGGRGAPYHFGSTVEARFDMNDRVFGLLESTLQELFPGLDAEVTHRWGGPLAMPRDHSPYVEIDHHRGLAAAGGYTGDGVVLSRVAATALADLITAPDVATDVTRLPFVQRPPRHWEVEPLRWLGVNAGLTLATWADHHERRYGTESRAGAALDRLLH